MCDQCGKGTESREWKSEPGTPERMREVLALREDHVMEYGHQVLGIFGEEGEKFFYSVGRCVYEKDELLLTGPLPNAVAMFIINEAARLIDDGTIVPDPTGVVEVGADVLLRGFPCRIIPCDPLAGEMHQALNINPNLKAYQIIWPDTDGHWPGESDYDARFTQPIHAIV